MSDTTASLRRKIDSAGDLQSVVRTMKALAASSIGQYEKSLRALSDYYRTVEFGLSVCLRQLEPGARWNHNGQRIEGALGAVVFGSDQGLVGRFNEIVVEHAVRALGALHQTPRVWAVGERVYTRLAAAGLPLSGLFSVPTSVEAIAPLVGEILLASEKGRSGGSVSELHLFYNRPEPGSAYAPASWQLLPLNEDWLSSLVSLPWPAQSLPEIMGMDSTTLRTLISEYLFISLFRACAESLASENASRLAAMERAEKNIDELLETLNSTFHRLRQSNIDEELFDVVAGFEALSPHKTRGSAGKS